MNVGACVTLLLDISQVTRLLSTATQHYTSSALFLGFIRKLIVKMLINTILDIVLEGEGFFIVPSD